MKRLLCSGLVFAMSIATANVANGNSVFSDLQGDHTSFRAIEYLNQEGVIEGYADGTFKPSNQINRAEFTKILIGAKLNAEEISGENCFPDVRNEWFAPYVCAAKELGIIEGYADGTFKPADNINFAEASKIIAGTYNLTQTDAEGLASQWFAPFVQGLQNARAIPLSIDDFDKYISRSEMAEMIWRIDANEQSRASKTFQEIEGRGLITANSCVDLRERIEFNELYNEGYYPEIMPISEVEESTDRGSGDQPASTPSHDFGGLGGANGAADFSSTNVQVEGVDEADIVKNDGEYIYLVKQGTIRIIKAYPADEMQELISMSFDETGDFYPHEMYLDGDQLVIIGMSYPDYSIMPYDADLKIHRRHTDKTKVLTLDISNRAAPKLERTVEYEGYYASSRKVGSSLYLVSNYYPNYYLEYPRIMPADDIREMLPMITDSATGRETRMADCHQIRIWPYPMNNSLSMVVGFDLSDNKSPVSREVFMGSSDTIFSSRDNLYIARSIFRRGEQLSKIYKFALDNGKVAFHAEATIAGTLLNQFSMDEFRGNLRVAVTEAEFGRNFWMSTETTNSLYILDEDLNQLSKLEGLAPEERIYSVRFMGDRGYMVTFREVDPLFVLDLSNPRNPRVMGELKIPGFSTYLHPLDENHLIGFGRDVDENAENNWMGFDGFKMSLFDVSNPANPIEKHLEIIGEQGTYSELLHNHKALYFNSDRNILAFPITKNEYQADNCSDFSYSSCPSNCQKICTPMSCTFENGIRICTSDCDGPDSCMSPLFDYAKPVFEGAMVYSVDIEEGFELLAEITHLNDEDIAELLKNGWISKYEKSINRVLSIGQNLYTVSQWGVKANSIVDFEELNVIELKDRV